MIIGNRLKELRESKQLSQGDIEKRTGLLRCYISRVENGHTVPAIETLEKMARALEVPMYRLFHEGEVEASIHKLKPPKDDAFSSAIASTPGGVYHASLPRPPGLLVILGTINLTYASYGV